MATDSSRCLRLQRVDSRLENLLLGGRHYFFVSTLRHNLRRSLLDRHLRPETEGEILQGELRVHRRLNRRREPVVGLLNRSIFEAVIRL